MYVYIAKWQYLSNRGNATIKHKHLCYTDWQKVAEKYKMQVYINNLFRAELANSYDQ